MLNDSDFTVILAMFSPVYIALGYFARKISDICVRQSVAEQREKDKSGSFGY